MGLALSKEAQRQLIKSQLKAGCLLHIFCDFTRPPKNKFIVIVHIDFKENLLLCFLVNSEKNSFIESKPELKNSQVELNKNGYSFLTCDSYLNCSEVIDDIDIDEVVDHLMKKPKDNKCILLDNEILEIIQIVKCSTTITDYDKKIIINSLGSQ